MADYDVVIVGGGLAGLACAVELQRRGVHFLILEAHDEVGGRVRTDRRDGFLLDRGFQVLLEAYPECRRLLDYGALELQPFFPGAQIWTGGSFARFADPFKRPQDAMATLRSQVGSFSDKFRVARLRKEVMDQTVEEVLAGPDRTTRDDLKTFGFSQEMIREFFTPFFGGVLLDPGLADSARLFRFIFKMFSEGETAVPRKGMGEIPRQLAERLPEGAVRLAAPVHAVMPGRVRLGSGEDVEAEAVVVATEGPEAARLLPNLPDPGSKAAISLYFEAPEPPVRGPILVLNGTGAGPVNHVAVMTEVSDAYAPPGQHQVSASCLGDLSTDPEALETEVRRQMTTWFGRGVQDWRHLETYRIHHAQPLQGPGVLAPAQRDVRLGPGVYVCGDHRETASLNGALHSGRRAAEAILEDASAGTGPAPSD